MYSFPRYSLILFTSLIINSLSAQNFQEVFPGSSGAALLDSLFDHYKPGTVLSYADSRDTLYAKILAKDDDSLHCIYSDHTLYLDPTQDPTQYIYLNGTSNGMNTEHAYPQSKGAADGNPRSDMHHLYPTRIAVNEARADKPFAEIPDAQTDKWFVNNQVFFSIPALNKDLYSESSATAFEPRESVKGDLARSVFYFFTMYHFEAITADPNYFELQRPTLCQWNAQDPADAAELLKTWRIAPYQEGKPNPFVLDCTLANRSWCPETAPNCVLGTNVLPKKPSLNMKVSPHPVVAGSPARLELYLPFSGALHGRIISVLGQDLASFAVEYAPEGTFSLPLDVSALRRAGGWLGFLEVSVTGPGGKVSGVQPLIVW